MNWLSTLATNNSNSSSATSSLIHGTIGNPYLPPIALILTVVLYLVLVIAYQSSPGRGKLLAIATIVMVLSLFQSVFGLLANAVISIIIFVLAMIITTLFQAN